MERFNVGALQEFSTDKRVRKMLAHEGRIEIDLLFYTPGQSSPEHKHPEQDEMFYVVSGEGTMLLDSEPTPLHEKDIIYAPSGTLHGIQNTSSANLTMLFCKNTLPKKQPTAPTT